MVAEIDGKVVAHIAMIYGYYELYDRLEEGSWISKGTNYATNRRGVIDLSLIGTGFGQWFENQV